MTRVLRSAVKKNQIKEDQSSNLSISKKSKTVKRNTKKKVLNKSKESQQNDIWSISSIVSNIFKYAEKNDIINFNTVCKTWNNVTNPIIHKTIKLQRKRAFQNKDHDKRFLKSAKTDAEVELCISNNSKHAPFIKEFEYHEKLKPQRAIQLFETFKFITNLTIGGSMSQDQFISMIIPLTQLQELNLRYLRIKKIVTKKYISEPAILPPSLTKLSIERISLYKNPELFVQTINSHTNLLEFRFDFYSYNSNDENIFLDPFFKNYPSLEIIDLSQQHMDYSQSLIKAFEFNPQLRMLKLSLSRCNDSLMSNLSRYLTNLEVFNFTELNSYHEGQSSIISKFTHPTKIKKLNLTWSKLSQCSLNSILLNCPYLEELHLNYLPSFRNTVSDISINPLKLANIKKLNLKYGNLSTSSYNSILMKCARAKELDIELPIDWKDCIKVIGNVCTDLESLVVRLSYNTNGHERNTFYQEFYESQLLDSNTVYRSTLRNLTLYNLNFYDSKAEYFNNFENLEYIEFPSQYNANDSTSSQDISFNKDLWPNYKFISKSLNRYFSVKMVKILP
jgi:hypothetical protein